MASDSDDSGDDFLNTSSTRYTSEQTAIRNALHHAVGNICREEENAGKDSSISNMNMTMSKKAIGALTELTYHYATKCLAKDIVAFSQHAKRKTIVVDDVKLVARKNPRGLLASLEGFCDDQTSKISNNTFRDQIASRKTRSKDGRNIHTRRKMLDDSASSSDEMFSPSSSSLGKNGITNVKKSKINRRDSSSSSSSSDDSDIVLRMPLKKAPANKSSNGMSGSDSTDDDYLLHNSLRKRRKKSNEGDLSLSLTDGKSPDLGSKPSKDTVIELSDDE